MLFACGHLEALQVHHARYRWLIYLWCSDSKAPINEPALLSQDASTVKNYCPVALDIKCCIAAKTTLKRFAHKLAQNLRIILAACREHTPCSIDMTKSIPQATRQPSPVWVISCCGCSDDLDTLVLYPLELSSDARSSEPQVARLRHANVAKMSSSMTIARNYWCEHQRTLPKSNTTLSQEMLLARARAPAPARLFGCTDRH